MSFKYRKIYLQLMNNIHNRAAYKYRAVYKKM